jgi:uncharacterized membrane protein
MVRRFALTAHVTLSVGWMGAVAVFLALALIAVTHDHGPTVRGAYLVMEPAAWFALVPLAFASLLTGTVMSLGTTWGLFRHYWVVFKLLLTVFATIILLIYMETFRQMAALAADPAVELAAVRNLSPALHSVLAILVLLVATVLGIYKPYGLTPYGRRPRQTRVDADAATERDSQSTGRASAWMYAVAMIAIVLLVLMIGLHLAGGGMRGH